MGGVCCGRGLLGAEFVGGSVCRGRSLLWAGFVVGGVCRGRCLLGAVFVVVPQGGSDDRRAGSFCLGEMFQWRFVFLFRVMLYWRCV